MRVGRPPARQSTDHRPPTNHQSRVRVIHRCRRFSSPSRRPADAFSTSLAITSTTTMPPRDQFFSPSSSLSDNINGRTTLQRWWCIFTNHAIYIIIIQSHLLRNEVRFEFFFEVHKRFVGQPNFFKLFKPNFPITMTVLHYF